MGDPGSVDALVDSLGALDVLVNNAGANFPGGRDEWEPEAFAAALTLNLAGPMRLTTGCRDRLRASTMDGGASVINMASMSAFRSVPIVPGYGSAKAGLVTLTQNLARHWVGDGIRVNAVAPGVIDTPMTAPMKHFSELLDAELAHTPMGRLGIPGEVAPAVQFLASSGGRLHHRPCPRRRRRIPFAMSPRALSPHYHVGIVVPDIGAAQAELSDQLGVTWGPVLRLDAVDYRDGSGEDIVLPTAMCYSVESPHLELIEEVPGSVWVRNEHSNLHHIGFWSDDLPHDSARLAGSGCPLQLCGRAGVRPRSRSLITGTTSASAWRSSTPPCARPWRSCSNPTRADRGSRCCRCESTGRATSGSTRSPSPTPDRAMPSSGWRRAASVAVTSPTSRWAA